MMLVKFILFLFAIHTGLICASHQEKYLFVRENDILTLVCKQYYRSEVHIWKGPKNGTTYAVGTRINTSLRKQDRLKIIRKESPLQLNLQIGNFSKEDEGDYKCVFTNKDGFISRKHFTVLMQRDPSNLTIQNEQPNHLVYGYVNRTLTLSCTVLKGIPSGRIQWITRNVSLVVGRYGSANYTFKPQLSDQHTNFTCIAKNEYSLKPIKRSVQLFLYELPTVEIKQGRVINVTEGNVLKLDCLFSSNHEISLIVWKYVRPQGETLRLISNNSIYRRDHINRNQSGKYECIVKNNAGTVTDDILVTVQYAPYVRLIYNGTTLSGRTITCFPSGFPDTYVFHAWEHMSESNEHIRFMNDNGTGTLEIPVRNGETDRHHDRGFYVCRVSNGIKFKEKVIISAKYFLNASGKPYFVSSNNNYQVGISGQSTQLFVLVVSIPEFDNVTVFNKSLIPIAAVFEYQKSVQTSDCVYGKNTTVTATNISLRVQLNDWIGIRQYSVAVSNEYGTTIYTINVQSTRLPEMPSEIRTLARQKEILIYWKSGFNGGYQQFIVVRYRKANDVRWIVHQAGAKNSTVIHDLLPNTEYYIQLFARNKIGKSKFTEQYPIKTADVPVKSFSEGTVVILITAIVILVVALVSVGIILGLKSVMRQKKTNQSEESAEHNGAEDYRTQYEDIDNISNIPGEHLTTEDVGSEANIMLHIDNTVYLHETGINESKSQLCISEMINSLGDPESDKSSGSSEMSYLVPSRPYTELKYLRNSCQSLHEYEQVRIRRKNCIFEEWSNDSCDKKVYLKRSTI